MIWHLWGERQIYPPYLHNEPDWLHEARVVIDFPNQQDQDIKNYYGILKFIRDNASSGSQTIVALVDDYNIDFGGDVVQMDEKLHALSLGEYDDIASELKPFKVAIIGATG